MKLNIDFSAFINIAKKMGVKVTDIDFNNTKDEIDTSFIDKLTKPAGIEVNLEDVKTAKSGVFTYKGENVVLFIPDQWNNSLEDIKVNPNLGKKFHFLNCSTLQKMKAEHKFNRYFVNQNSDGLFKVFNNMKETGIVKLNVCQNCLKQLNYHDVNLKSAYEKQSIVNNFNLKKFFEEYSSRIYEVPKSVGQNDPGYANDWDEISKEIRQKYGYICQECKVNLSKNKELCQVHHKNGVKRDNSPSNLIVLCKECHNKHHGHLRLTFDEMLLLNKLRRIQKPKKL